MKKESILSLGTAQFGLNYGIKNNHKQLNFSTVNQILNVARDNFINTIDTAQGYGDSELVLGQYFKTNSFSDYKIITKINKSTDVAQQLKDSFSRLNHQRLYGVLVHDFNLYRKDPSIFNTLQNFKEANFIEKIGFSLYYPEELEFLLSNNIRFDIIQIAYSIFDRRFEKYFQLLSNRNVEIHVRSVFLQGLFFLDPMQLTDHFNSVRDKLIDLHHLSENTGLSIASICLNFTASNPYINKIVVGVDSPEDLLANIKVLEEKLEVTKILDRLDKYSITDLNILFPHFWKLN